MSPAAPALAGFFTTSTTWEALRDLSQEKKKNPNKQKKHMWVIGTMSPAPILQEF